VTNPGGGKPLIFVSCGQRGDEETKLGFDICRLINETTTFEAYFAEEQHSLEGLTDHIFRRLYRARGFVCVLHRRGAVTFADGRSQERASVFVEQEIAILSFLRLVLGEEIPVSAFIEEGIALEGVRKFIPFNPTVFRSPADVLIELARVLPTWKPRPSAALELGFKLVRSVGYNAPAQRHTDMLEVTLHNRGSKPIERYVVEVEIPRGVLDPGPLYTQKVPERSRGDIDFFRFNESVRRPSTIFAGDELSVWNMRFDSVADTDLGKKEAKATLRVGDEDPQSVRARLDGSETTG
jgi:hypothetical protein